MKKQRHDTASPGKLALKTGLLIAFVCLLAMPAAAQNSKGDKPAANPSGPFLRLPKKLFKSKSPDKAYTRDITGRRRIRTRNSSTASKGVYVARNIYKGRKQKKPGDRPAEARGRTFTQVRRGHEQPYRGTIQGGQLRVRSVTARRSRHNVYPQKGPYVSNPSPRPRKNERPSTRTVAGKRVRNRVPNYSYGKRGRKDVYWGKFSKGERPFLKDLTGRSLRTRNFMSGGAGVGTSDTLKTANRKPGKTAKIPGYPAGQVGGVAGNHERPWTGDISGHSLRYRSARKSETQGVFSLPFKFGSPGRNKRSSQPLPPRPPGIGASGIAKSLRSLTGYQRQKGGGIFKGKRNNNGQPIDVRGPGIGGNVGNFRGHLKAGDVFGFGAQGYGFAGNFKRGRPLKGGGSVSSKLRANGQPVPVRGPGVNIGMFPGHFKGSRPLKGGGSVSGKFRANGQPVQVKGPGVNIGMFPGHFKGSRPLKGGGSVTGKFRANGQSVLVRGPGIGANGMQGFRGKLRQGDLNPSMNRQGAGFAGTFKGRRPLKGGGSVSGRVWNKWNNRNSPIDVRTGGAGSGRVATFQGNLKSDQVFGFGRQGYGYAGNIRGHRPLKGGGSVTGKFLRSNREPVPVRGGGDDRIARFQGNFQRGELVPGFGRQGYGWAGNKRTYRPEKGGGSISGKFLGNKGRPIDVRFGAPGFDKVAHWQGKFRVGELLPGFSKQGYGWAGNNRTRRPEKGGGSISGKFLSNSGRPVEVRFGAPGFDKPAHFRGNFHMGELQPGFTRQGYGWAGNQRTRKPAKGGGTISGKFLSNDGKPITVRTPTSDDAKGANYSGKIALSFFKRYFIKNPNAVSESLKKRKPNPNSWLASGLQVKDKQGKYTRKPHAADNALRGIGPKDATVKASEYSRAMKMYWSYKHNPSSNAQAMKTIQPHKGWDRVLDFSGNARMSGSLRHNPSASKDALKAFSPGKAYARINDFAGNSKMFKYNGRLHPDAKFAHGFRDNVKSERTLAMNFKLFWAKLFRKNDNQPGIVKEKERRPRYDKKEKDLWKALYD